MQNLHAGKVAKEKFTKKVVETGIAYVAWAFSAATLTTSTSAF